MTYAVITQAEKDRFVYLFGNGVTYKGLSAEFNRSVETMRSWRCRFGLPPRQRKGVSSENKIYQGFYVDAETNAKLMFVARRAGVTKSEFLRRLLQRKLQGVRADAKKECNSRSLHGYSHVVEGTR